MIVRQLIDILTRPPGRVGAIAALGCLGLSVLAADVAPSPAPAEGEIPKSVFTPGGKDPFYPEANAPEPPAKGATSAAKREVRRDLYAYLKITGFIHSRRPQVTINTTTFVAGDPPLEVKLIVPNADNVPTPQKALVRIIEIREKSVVVNIEGQTQPRELFWHEGR